MDILQCMRQRDKIVCKTIEMSMLDDTIRVMPSSAKTIAMVGALEDMCIMVEHRRLFAGVPV
jgi:predicted CoA-binding protein